MKPRGPVVWKQSAAITGDKVARTRQHTFDKELPTDLKPVYEAAMQPGSMFATLVDLQVQVLNKDVTPPPFPVLEQHWPRTWDPAYDKLKSCIPAKALALYAGQIRVEEEGKQGKLRVIRHTFIINGGRFIVTDLNWIQPV